MNDENEDTVARLVRMAGPRPRIDADRSNRVREAVHAEWQRNVQRRKRTRYTFAAVALAATLAAIAFLIPIRQQTSAPTNITPVARGIEAPGTHDWNGATLRVGANTRVTLNGTVATLDAGTIYYASGTSTQRITISTPFGDIHDIGTRFEVRLDDDSVRVRVDEGRVELRGTTIAAPLELFATATAIEPQLTIEGKTLATVVESIAAARGLRVRWDTASRDVALHGNVPLSLDEALDAATAASGVTHRIANDELVVSR